MTMPGNMPGNSPEDLAGQVRVMQIILAALVMGMVFFLLVACLAGGMGNGFGPPPMLTTMALGMAAIMVVARMVVLPMVTSIGRRKIAGSIPETSRGASSRAAADDTTGRIVWQLVALYQTRLIVGAAMLEGAVFFLLVTFLVEHSLWSLGTAIVLILAVAAHFPTQEMQGTDSVPFRLALNAAEGVPYTQICFPFTSQSRGEEMTKPIPYGASRRVAAMPGSVQ
jgi:hypothetical protein